MTVIKKSNHKAFDTQRELLFAYKKRKSTRQVKILGMELTVFPKVYVTSRDTKLVAKAVRIKKNESFLELGTGSGAIALYLSKKAKAGLAVDINLAAVKNAKYNAAKLGVGNLSIRRSNLFSNVRGKFDVIVFNPLSLLTYPRTMSTECFGILGTDPK